MHYQGFDVQDHQWIAVLSQPAEVVLPGAQYIALVDHVWEATLQRHIRFLTSCIWNKVARHHISPNSKR